MIGPQVRQGLAEEGAPAPQAARPEAGAADLQRDRVAGRAHRAQPLHRRRARGRRGERMKLAYWPGCVSRGFTPELHGSGREGGAAARPRAGRARPRELLRRRRDRRAQPGAGRHPERPHVRDGAAGAGRRRDDEHLLDLPGRAVGVPGAARRERRLPRRGEQAPRRRGPLLPGRRRLVEQELPLDPRRGDRLRRAARARAAPARGACGSRPSTAATSCGRRSGSASTSTPSATLPGPPDRGARRRGRWSTPARASAAASR